MLIALNTLSHMAGEPNRVHASADITDHAGANLVIIRRILGNLREADLLSFDKGHTDGWQLATPAESVALADVYLPLEEKLVSRSSSDA